MSENELATIVVNIAFQIHSKLVPGLLESVYEEIMVHELLKLNLMVERQKAISVHWNNLKMELGFRADIIVENKLIVELKSIESLAPVHSKILLTYLRATGMKLGLLINFNEEFIRNGIKRVVNNL